MRILVCGDPLLLAICQHVCHTYRCKSTPSIFYLRKNIHFYLLLIREERGRGGYDFIFVSYHGAASIFLKLLIISIGFHDKADEAQIHAFQTASAGSYPEAYSWLSQEGTLICVLSFQIGSYILSLDTSLKVPVPILRKHTQTFYRSIGISAFPAISYPVLLKDI